MTTVPQYLARALRPRRAASLRAAHHLCQHHNIHGGGDLCGWPGAVGLFRLAIAVVHCRYRNFRRHLRLIYGGLNTVAWTGVLTAIVKIGGVGTFDRAGTESNDAIGWHNRRLLSRVMRDNNVADQRHLETGGGGQCGPHHDPAPTAPITASRVFQPADHPLIPVGRHVLQHPGSRRLVWGDEPVHRPAHSGRASDIWHARMGMVMAGYAKLFLPFIIVLPGLILFSKPSRIPGGRLEGCATHRGRWRLCGSGARVLSPRACAAYCWRC